jgi:hypothetical protein
VTPQKDRIPNSPQTAKPERENKPALDRRKFLSGAAAAGVFTIVPRHVLGGQAHVAPSDKITLGYIGIGTQGIRELLQMLPTPEIQVVAVCDPEKDNNHYVEFTKGSITRVVREFLKKPNWRQGASAAPGGREVGKEIIETYYAEQRAADKFSGVATYADFRELLDKEKDLDAVKIMTPDHLHATIAIAAMKRGKHTIMHKPLANRLHEGKLVFDAARESKVATHFMAYGSGRGGDMDRIMSWIKDGAIGTVREIHNWTNRPMWPQYQSLPTDRPPIPEGFDWNLWLGPALDRAYHPNYTHTVFRGWYDFGGGSIADMGHYSLWPVFTAFQLGTPVRVEPYMTHTYEVVDEVSRRVKNDFSFPIACSLRFKMPAHEGWPDLDLFWYDGGMRPQRPRELAEDGRELEPEGMMFIGDKGIILDGRIIPERKMKAFPGPQPPPLDAPRGPRGGGAAGDRPNRLADWIKAVQGGPQSPGNFLNAVTLTETVNLASVALRAGETIEYDPATRKITNVSEANKYLVREYRPGWELG